VIKPFARMEVALGACVMLVLVGVVYVPGLFGGFVFDDYSNIVLNTNLHVSTLEASDWIAAALSSPSRDLPRPLALLTLATNHYFTGLASAPMKLTNILIHLLNCVLVFGLARRILEIARPDWEGSMSSRLALGASTLWALLPINLMAVLLVVQRMESLANVFVLLGLSLYLDGRRAQLSGTRGWSRILLGLIACTAVGMASKESAALLPAYALAMEVMLFRFRDANGDIDRRLPGLFVLVLLIPTLVAVAWLSPKIWNPAAWAHRNFDLGERQLTEFRVLLDYLRWTLVPSPSELSLFHDDYPVSTDWLQPWTTLAAFVALLAFATLGWALRTRRPLLSLGVALFFLAHLLTATVLPLELVFEHRNYFASFGIVLVLLDVLLVAPRRPVLRTAGRWAFLSLIALNAGATFLRANEWSDPVRFARTEAAKRPDSPRATYHLAQALSNSSPGDQLDARKLEAFEAFERARRVPNAGIAPAQGELLLAARTGRPADPMVWAEIDDRLRRGPIGPQELGAIGSLTACVIEGVCRFNRDDMMRMFMAVQSHGESPEVYQIFGTYALRELNNPDLAESSWKRAEALNPSEPQHVIALARLYISIHRDRDALDAIRRLRAIGPLGRTERAARELERRLVARDAAGTRDSREAPR
jgi:hypothetical protein